MVTDKKSERASGKIRYVAEQHLFNERSSARLVVPAIAVSVMMFGACGVDPGMGSEVAEAVRLANETQEKATGPTSGAADSVNTARTTASASESRDESEEPMGLGCTVTAESWQMTEEERAELQAELARTSLPPTLPPGVREVGEPPSVEELRQPPVPFEVRVPSDEVLERQRAFFTGRQRAIPDLSRYEDERRASISRDIERSRGMSPLEMLEAVEHGELSFEAVEAVAIAESSRVDRREKYEILLRGQ